MAIEIAVVLTIAGMSAFFGAGEYEARDGGSNHRVLWAGLSLLISVLVLSMGAGVTGWLLGQGLLLIGIAAVRVWLEDRANK
ncbi:MAG TPA: hypothetical protein VFH71_11705 [Rhodanobacteraceae bacterium]|nr:hypothetical protein [Rhodanobacteraceae bacterium]